MLIKTNEKLLLHVFTECNSIRQSFKETPKTKKTKIKEKKERKKNFSRQIYYHYEQKQYKVSKDKMKISIRLCFKFNAEFTHMCNVSKLCKNVSKFLVRFDNAP